MVDDLDPVIAAYSKDYGIARKISALEEKRQALLQALDLPAHLSPNAMLPVLSALYDRQALLETIKKL